MKTEDTSKDIMERYPILFKDYNRPMTETCQCWGLEMGEGWYSVMDEYSALLESVNLTNKKYNVVIRSDQTKSKYGTLHWYYDVVVENPGWMNIPYRFINWMHSKFRNIDFKMKRIEDVPAKEELRIDEISKEDYDRYMSNVYDRENVFAESGKYFVRRKLYTCAKCHYVPTRHKIAYTVSKFLNNMKYRLDFTYNRNPSKIQETVKKATEVIARVIVRMAEDKCAKTCEECGSSIGSDWNPTCETVGWISYLCEDCAKKENRTYYKNGKMYSNGKLVKKTNKSKKTKKVE